MVNKNSIYALNKKDPDAIVYPSASGKPIRVTREDFPSEEEFLAFKKWSDENFHEEEKLDHREANHALSTEDLSEAALATPAVDVVMERQYQREEQRRITSDMVIKLKDKLTDKQFRRLWQLKVEGKTLEEIAALEGVAFQSVHESIESALKKISKNF
ncbi:MAG: sigma-70 family RNA polymerase sigma factor [Blautia sp.]|nr:sigma-70 family RNA polymerase sigma factor [Blautia sp.]